MSITDNYAKVFPVNTLGTPELAYFVVDMGEDVESDYDSSDSLYSQAVKALQLKTDLYMVGLPSGNVFTFAARVSSIPGAVAGATSGVIASLGADIAEVCGDETVLSVSIRNGGGANDVGDEFDFTHPSFSSPLRVRVTASNAGVATAVEILDGGVWTDQENLPTNTTGMTRTQTGAGFDWNGNNLQLNINTWGLGGVEVYNASIVGSNLVWND